MQRNEPTRKSRQGRIWIRDAGLILLGVLSLIFRQSSPGGVDVAWSHSTGREGPRSHGFHRRLRRQVLGPAVALLAAEDWPAFSARAEDKTPIDLDTYKSKITRLLGEVPVYAVTDPSGSPVLEDVEQRLGRFYMDPDDASAALRRVNTGSKNLEVRKLVPTPGLWPAGTASEKGCMLEQLKGRAQEKFLLEVAEDDVVLRAQPQIDAAKVGLLEYGQVVLVRDFSDGWARLHEDEVWASNVLAESEDFDDEPPVFVLVDGRRFGLPRYLHHCSTNLEEWQYSEALQCAEANGVLWRKLRKGLRPKSLVDLAWLSGWHSPDGTIFEAPPLLHEDHRDLDRPLPRLCVASMVRGIAPRMLESLILHHHANGFEKVVIYFDCPDDPGEQEAIAAVEQFAKPLPTGPVGMLCRAVAVRCTEAWWTEVRRSSRYYLREDETLELYRETAHLDANIKDVQARQMLCIEDALFEAQSEGFEWLLHVDADEILFFPDQERHADARRFFAEVPLHFTSVRFANLEAAPQSLETGDPFEEVSLFKMNPMLLEELGVEPRILSSGEVAEEDEELEPDLFTRQHADAVPGGHAHSFKRLPRKERHALRRLLSVMHDIAAKRTPVLEQLKVKLNPVETRQAPDDDSSDDESCFGPRPHCPAYFNSYSNGKSAVRTSIGPRGELPPLPAGVHGFLRDGGMTLYTLLCKGPGAPVVLHYANCGFDSWRQKYELLCTGH
ncbi:ELD1, partial [Symbiodinium necroappetens]